MQNQPIRIERVYNASIGKVWKAITDKDLMKKWYFNVPEFKAEVGNEFTFTGGPDDGKQYVHLCKVVEVAEEKIIAYTWRYEGQEGTSKVTFELSEQDGKTKLILTHEGLETFPQDNPDMDKKNFQAGWTQIIGNSLPEFLSKN